MADPIQGRDPRSGGLKPSGVFASPQQSEYLDAAMVDLGNGTGALLVITATRAVTTPAASATSVQLLAADQKRYAVTIQNTDSTKNLYVGLGHTATAADPVVAPGASYQVPSANVGGVINGIWDSGASGPATVTATTH